MVVVSFGGYGLGVFNTRPLLQSNEKHECYLLNQVFTFRFIMHIITQCILFYLPQKYCGYIFVFICNSRIILKVLRQQKAC